MKNFILIIVAILSHSICVNSQVDAGLTSQYDNPELAQEATLYYKFKADFQGGSANDWNSQQFTIKYPDTYPNFSSGSIAVSNENSCFSWSGFDATTTGGFHYIVFADFDGGSNCDFSNGDSIPMFTLTFAEVFIGSNLDVEMSIIDLAESMSIGGFGEPAINNAGSGTNIFENFDNQTQNVILPITLKSFSANKESERSVLLEWVSSSEVNASHFEVQRLNKFNEWKSIGNVKATGTANSNTNYTYLDTEIDLRSVYDSDNSDDHVGVNYRLKMVDLDGASEYSEKDAVSLREFLGELTVYPNPTVNEVLVSIDNVSELGGTLTIIDNQGATFKTQALLSGRSERISMNDVPSGIYLLSVKQGEKVYTKKIVKID